MGTAPPEDPSLSQVGAAVLGAEAAERESRPAMAAGMGPSSPTSNTLSGHQGTWKSPAKEQDRGTLSSAA